MDNPIELEKSEREVIDAANEIKACVTSSGWKRLSKWMADWVEIAREDMENNISTDPALAYRLQMRWKERKGMMDAMLGAIEDTQAAKEEVLVNIAKSRGANQEQALEFAQQGIF